MTMQRFILPGLIGIFITAAGACSHQYSTTSSASADGLSLSPEGGPLAGGSSLTILGSSLVPGGVTEVQVGGAKCPITAISNGALTCTTPAGTLGWASVTITAKGEGTAQLAQKYAYGANVVGQRDMVSNFLAYGNSLTQPEAAVNVGTSLYVADGGDARVAVYSPAPIASSVTPTTALGASDIAGSQIGYSSPNGLALSMAKPRAVCTDGTRVMVADSAHHRIVIYNTAPPSWSTLPNFVLGQRDLTGQEPNRASATVDATMLNSPEGIYCDATHIIVADTANNRVLIWNVPITASGQPANVVVGQGDVSSVQANRGGAVSAISLMSPRGVLLSGGALYVSDSGNQRVLWWSALPTTFDQGATLALGPTSLTSANGGGCTASGLSSPAGLARSGNFLYVADRGLNRVLAWDLTSAGGIGTWSSGQAATVSLGQGNLTTCSVNQGLSSATAGTLSAPAGVFSGGTNLLISDTGNNRVLIYNTAPTSTGATADLFLGQSSVSGVSPAHAMVSSSTMKSPQSAAVFAGALYVSDSVLNRVLVFNPTPGTPGSAATLVFGQPDMITAVSNSVSGTISAQTLSVPRALLVDTVPNLYVADSANNRILMYAGLPSASTPSATLAIGQGSLGTGAAATTATGARGPQAICLAGGQLFVADTVNNRVLVYNAWTPSSGTGQAATYAIGQPDLTSGSANQGATVPSALSLSSPSGLACNSTKLVVSDSGNQRILIYNLPISASGGSAALVLGQTDFTSRLPNRGSAGASASSVYNPRGVALDGSKLFIADARNHRVLIWSSFPTANGQAANSVFGQASMNAYYPNRGSALPSLTTLNTPEGLSVSNGQLVISDSGNARVVIIPEP